MTDREPGKEPDGREPDGGGAEQPRTYAPDFLTQLFRTPLDPGYADAAARRAEVGPVTGWRRNTRRAAMVATMLVVGVLLSVAYRQTMHEEPSRSQARAGLVGQIRQSEADTAELQRRAESLRAEVARQRAAALDDRDAARLRELEAVTGLARVRGDGVVVRVADGPAAVDAVTGAGGANLGRVLDRDLQDIANALWGAGAEAVSINGQRLTATSTIRAAGSAILVDFRPVTGPYEVSAIGPRDMDRRFNASGAARLLRAVAADHGMSFEVRRVDDLDLPAAGEPRLRHAVPSPSVSPTPVSPGPSGSTGQPAGTPSPSGAGPSTSAPGGG
ncbi:MULTISPECIES: DUF881 domain-containing protein [Polymorphospora]|uniref:DUF881 domain-containing protein n=1 Tax=Polymorphospora lycopeni TaxID=3140240 RepID=A0ABV5D1L0_9ACTN